MAAPRSFNVDHGDSPAERDGSLASETNNAATGSGAARPAAFSRAGTVARRQNDWPSEMESSCWTRETRYG